MSMHSLLEAIYDTPFVQYSLSPLNRDMLFLLIHYDSNTPHVLATNLKLSVPVGRHTIKSLFKDNMIQILGF